MSAQRLPCFEAAISRPVARPAGSELGALPSTGQRSDARGLNPTVTGPPGWKLITSSSCAIASR